MNTLEYQCPKCFCSNDLRVVISAVAKLHQDEGNFETEIVGDQEWDSCSRMQCYACGFDGEARDFTDIKVPTGPPRIKYDPSNPDDPNFWIWRIGEQNFVDMCDSDPVFYEGSMPWPAWLFASESWASEMENKRRNPDWSPDSMNTEAV